MLCDVCYHYRCIWFGWSQHQTSHTSTTTTTTTNFYILRWWKTTNEFSFVFDKQCTENNNKKKHTHTTHRSRRMKWKKNIHELTMNSKFILLVLASLLLVGRTYMYMLVFGCCFFFSSLLFGLRVILRSVLHGKIVFVHFFFAICQIQFGIFTFFRYPLLFSLNHFYFFSAMFRFDSNNNIVFLLLVFLFIHFFSWWRWLFACMLFR